MSNKCFLVIDLEEKTYIGSLIFKDHAFCGQISNLLREQVGCPIEEIGDLDVSHLLWASLILPSSPVLRLQPAGRVIAAKTAN
jgi:hypothetical protein